MRGREELEKLILALFCSSGELPHALYRKGIALGFVSSLEFPII